MRLPILVINVLLSLFAGMVTAQVNPYSRMTDPRALARLDGPDSQPLRYAIRFGFPPDRDPDQNYILAQDTGAGIITHMWTTTDVPDSTTNIKLYVDDKLIISCTYYTFFEKINGALRGPLDTTYPGAQVCDVQIPYRKNFKITYIGATWNVYYAIAWRPVSDSNLVVPFALNPPFSLLSNQISAEKLFSLQSSPWDKEKPLQITQNDTIAPGGRSAALKLLGPMMIQKLQLQQGTTDIDQLDSVWLDIYWDGYPVPAVHAPIADFFCRRSGGIDIHSYSIVSDSSGFSCYFPMPFLHSAVIELVNKSMRPIQMHTAISYSNEAVDKNSYGYFHAYFSESNPTRINIFHPILHEHGRGKFIGLALAIPHDHSGVALEGDPIFTVDSNARNNFRYTGLEDYFDGGWWFLWRTFSTPFAGQTKFIEAFYRFHYLDAIDFTSSFDFSFQHGGANDNIEDYRSVAYYYKHPISFWVSRDTIKAGEFWNVAGSGYPANTAIVGKFDDAGTIFTTTTNQAGEFSINLMVPPTLASGARKLSVNNEVRPEPVYVISAAVVRAVTDSVPITLRNRDSLLLTGAGFDIGEKIQVFLDSILISDTDTIVAGSDYRFFAIVRMPNIADWHYHLRVVGDHGHEAMASDLITITRILPFEFEDLVPWAEANDGAPYSEYFGGYWYAHWSRSAVATYSPSHANTQVTFKFFVPVADTFAVKLFLTNGSQYAQYTYSLDGTHNGLFEGYKKFDFGDPRPSDAIDLGVIYFAKDTHLIAFKCIGRDTAASDWRLGADLLQLTPTTIMPLPKGVFTNDMTLSGIDSPGVINSYIVLYPNPAGEGELVLGLRTPPEEIRNGKLDITLTDILGRVRQARSDISIGMNGVLSQFDTHGLPSGNYLAEFTIRAGTVIQHFTRLVQIRQ
ncbi:MAG: DUF2961 domain-containing protein [Bacteroidota bacterium]|nr:DUF2961 domain-containing protein [Bacteroidota bacterium]